MLLLASTGLAAPASNALLPSNPKYVNPFALGVQHNDTANVTLNTTSVFDDWPEESLQCVSNGDKKGCYPRLMMIGAMKAGMTSVVRALKNANMNEGGGVCSMASDCMNFPNTKNDGKFHIKVASGGTQPGLLDADPQSWADVMDNKWKYYECYQKSSCEHRTFIDASPSYLTAPDAAARLVEFLPSDWVPELKVVALLREPIARSLSHFNVAIQSLQLPLCSLGNAAPTADKTATFEDEMMCDHQRVEKCVGDPSKKAVKLLANADLDMGGYFSCMGSLPANDPLTHSILGRSLYAPQLRTWHAPKLDEIKRSQVLVMTMDAILNNTFDSLNIISTFYGLGTIDKDELPEANFATMHNKTNGVQSVTTIACAVKERMEQFFAPWNDQLVKDLMAARENGDAPKAEPKFDGWQSSTVECV